MKKINNNKRAVFGDLVIGASMEKNVKWKMVRSAAVSAPVILCNPSTSRLTTKRYSPILYITYGIFSRSGLRPRVLFVNAPIWERWSGGGRWMVRSFPVPNLCHDKIGVILKHVRQPFR